MKETRNILVVEDEAVIRNLCARILARMGYEMIGAESVQEAKAAIRAQESIDVLVTDMRLPDGSGSDVIEDFLRKYPASNVLVVTGSPTPENEPERLRRLGVEDDDILWKPFDVKVFEARVLRCLDGRGL